MATGLDIGQIYVKAKREKNGFKKLCLLSSHLIDQTRHKATARIGAVWISENMFVQFIRVFRYLSARVQ